MDTLPSGVPPKELPLPLSGQRGITPAFGYDAPHLGVRGTSTLLSNVLLSTHYGRSDSCPLRRGSARVSSQRPPVRLLRGQVSLIHAPGLLTIPSPPPAQAPPCQGTLPLGRSDRDRIPLWVLLPIGTRGFATALQVRHLAPAESSSVPSLTGKASYGLVVHLLLLPTPSHDDAVAVGYRFTLNLERTFTSPVKCALRRTVRRLDAAFTQSDRGPRRRVVEVEGKIDRVGENALSIENRGHAMLQNSRPTYGETGSFGSPQASLARLGPCPDTNPKVRLFTQRSTSLVRAGMVTSGPGRAVSAPVRAATTGTL